MVEGSLAYFSSISCCRAGTSCLSPAALTEVIDRLRRCDAITQIYRVTGKNRLHVHAVAASGEEMEELIRQVIDPLPGMISCSCNTILARIKDIKGLRL